jgi:hypothetical protein
MQNGIAEAQWDPESWTTRSLVLRQALFNTSSVNCNKVYYIVLSQALFNMSSVNCNKI